MKNKPDIWIAIFASISGGIISVLHWPDNAIGIIVVFFGMIIAPGYVISRIVIRRPFDPWETYPLSFVLGAACFGLVGMVMFFARAPLKAAYPAMFIITVVAAATIFIYKKESNLWERSWSSEQSGLGWIFAAVILASIVVAWRLGSERDWGIEWDYYSYITMVRRIVTRGYAGNFPLSYAGEIHDPIHSYNIWALMWAVISRGTGVDPVMLYIKCAVVTVPAALLAFYSLTRILFSRAAGMAATICYVLYHFIAMGFIIMGRTGFYADDPSWLIIFPIGLRFGWEYLKGEENDRGLLVACVLSVCIAMMVHPLWGALTAMGISMAAIVRIITIGGAMDSKTRWLIRAGWVALIAPAIWAIWNLASHFIMYGGQEPESWWGFIFFLGLPLGLWMRRIVELAKTQRILTQRALRIIVAIVIALAPFIVLRYIESRGASPQVYDPLSPYKWYMTDSLFVLNPGVFTYTAPDMTFFPWIILGVAALPWLLVKYKKQSDPVSLFVAIGIILIPLIAFHPYLSWIFDRFLHIAYLKRALRFSTMFAAIAAGAAVWEIAKKSGKFAGMAVTIIGFAAAVAASFYPVKPPDFRGALSKAWFIMTKRPTEGLFWQSDPDAHLKTDIRWDTEEFAGILEKVPLQETVLSDAFTSYRLTAYRDIYVMARLKASTSVADQKAREKDSTALVSAKYNMVLVCDLLNRYHSRWILLSTDPGYMLRTYLLWDQLTVESILNDSDYFEPVAEQGPWVLLRARERCVP